MSDTTEQLNQQSDLIYGVYEKPPLRETIFAALQHLLAIFVAIITPPLIIADALKLDGHTTAFLISMALFASGVSTFVQCRGIGKVGCKMLCVQGTSFSFIGPIINAGIMGGLPLIFGCCMAAAPVEILVSKTFRYLKNVVTPLVSGIVVLLIGLSLMKVGILACGGGQAAVDNGTFGNWQHLVMSGTVLISVIIFNRSKNKYIRMSSIILGLILGYTLGFILDMVNMEGFREITQSSLNVPVPFKYGLKFSWSAFIPLALIYLITAIEASGDITANSMISGLPIKGKKYTQRVSSGVMADGINSMIAGVFNSFPNSIFAQNNGLIQLTGVASRYVGYFIAGMLIILGLFPGIGIVFSLMPDAVLGGATLLMFGTVAAAGIRIIASQVIDRKATMVIAISLSLGLGVEMAPEILTILPDTLRGVFSSGITTGGITAILANLFIKK